MSLKRFDIKQRFNIKQHFDIKQHCCKTFSRKYLLIAEPDGPAHLIDEDFEFVLLLDAGVQRARVLTLDSVAAEERKNKFSEFQNYRRYLLNELQIIMLHELPKSRHRV